MDTTIQSGGSAAATLRKQARTAGLWYLAMAITGPIGILVIPSLLSVPGDAAASLAKIAASPQLWAWGIVAYIASQLVFFPLLLAFRAFLADVDKSLYRLMACFVVASVPIALLGLVGRCIPALLAADPSLAAGFSPIQVEGLAMLGLKFQAQAEIIVGYFWGLWLLPLGLLVYRSGYFPRILGIFLVIGCAGYLVDSTVALALPAYRAAIAPFIAGSGMLGEIPFLVWLLAFGARARGPKAVAA